MHVKVGGTARQPEQQQPQQRQWSAGHGQGHSAGCCLNLDGACCRDADVLDDASVSYAPSVGGSARSRWAFRSLR